MRRILGVPLAAIVVTASSDGLKDYPGYYDGLDGLEFFWRPNTTHLQIALRTPESWVGWMGFGLSEPTVGSMAGSDIVFAYIDDNGRALASDRHATASAFPDEDCSQDWDVVSGSRTADGGLEVELCRLLDSRDGEDRPVAYGLDNPGRPFRVILAYGAMHGNVFKHHASNRVAVKLNLLDPSRSGDPLSHIRSDPDTVSLDLRPSSASRIDNAFGGGGGGSTNVDGGLDVPTQTSGALGYIDMCFNLNDLLPPLSEKEDPSVPYHVVGFEHLLDEQTSRFVHHFTVHGFYGSANCSSEGSGFFVFGWAPGVETVSTPEPAGYPIANMDAVLQRRGSRAESDGGGSTSAGRAFRSFIMQVHYDNPKQVAGQKDDSGLRLFALKTPREHDIGVLQLGDGAVSERSKKIPIGTSQMTAECPATCTEKLAGPIHVFATQLHQHQSGARMRTVTVRSGSVVTEGSASPRFMDYYNFGFQDFIYRDYDIEPGDALYTTCTYESSREGVRFGYGSWDEMCIDFVSYYPADPAWSEGYCGGEGGCGGRILEEIHSIPPETRLTESVWPSNSSCLNAKADAAASFSNAKSDAAASSLAVRSGMRGNARANSAASSVAVRSGMHGKSLALASAVSTLISLEIGASASRADLP